MSDWPEHSAKIGRLKKRQEFQDIQLSGESWVSSSIIVQYKYDDNSAVDDAPLRVGFTVSKKTSKLAVERNRIKRRLRALVQDVLPEKGRGGEAYVLIGRKETLNVPYERLRKDFIWCLKRLRS